MIAQTRNKLGITAGLATHAFLAVTVWRLFLFLQDTRNMTGTGPLAWDVLLALQFAMPHSALLHQAIRRRISRVIPNAFYGLFYTTAICVTLWTMFIFWRQSPVELWRLEGAGAALATFGFYLSWFGMLYSVGLTGFGWQTGWTPWIHWLRGQPPPRRDFEPRSLYRFLRHPVYASFLGLVWFTPVMSLDRAILTGVWSVYLLYGSYLKDERLAFYLGQTYRTYQSRVVGFPGMFFGPLGKRKELASLPRKVAGESAQV